MIKELTNHICGLPTVSRLTGGVTIDYSQGRNSGLCIKTDPGFTVIESYLDGTKLIKRMYRAELYFSFSGDTEEQLENRLITEAIESELMSAIYPEIPEGKIISITLASGGNSIKSAIGEGLLTFSFGVTYKTRLRRGDYTDGNNIL